jgi:PAS domain S-box-containing protein
LGDLEDKSRQESKELYPFFDLVPDLLCIASAADGYFKELNPAWEKTLGFTREELLSKPLVEFIHPDDRASTMLEVEMQLKRQPTAYFENRYICKDGSYRWLAWMATPAKGNLLYATARDITEHKKAEEELQKAKNELESKVEERTAELQSAVKLLQDEISERKKMEYELMKSETKYRQLFTTESDAIMIFDAKTREFVDVNDAALSLYGYTREEFLNLRHSDITAEPEQSDDTIKLTLYEGLKRIPFCYHKKKDGTVFPVEISSSSFELQDRIVLCGIVRDITGRKKAEEVLKTSNDIVQTIPSGLFIYQFIPPERLILINGNPESERLTGIKAKDWIGKEFNEMWPEAQKSGITEKYLNVMRTGKTYKTEDLYYKDLRLEGAFKIHAFKLPGHRLAVAFENITDRKKAEEEIKASLNEKEVLLQEIHHRVKNNMQVISSLMNLQQIHIKDKDSIEMLAETQNRIRSMALIHEKLYKSADLSKINFIKYIEDLSQSLFEFYEVDSTQISLEIDGKDVFLDIDTSVPCGLIINELVSNSLKHAFPDDRKGNVQITLHPINNEVFELAISDNGIGTREGLDIKNTKSLGLKLVDVLVRQINGNIKCNRTRGTEFIIKFKQK